MDMNVYPEFDIDAELARAEASVNYHLAQAAYFKAQITHLRAAKTEQMDLQRTFEESIDDPDVALISDAQMVIATDVDAYGHLTNDPIMDDGSEFY